MRSLLLFPLLAIGALAQSAPSSITANMDMTANPCLDFYQYACGTWMANNPIPPDQSRWGTFDQLADRNRAVLHGILEKASVDNARRSPVEQKIGDFYASCIDEPAIDQLGTKPLEPELKRIDAIKSKDQIADELVLLHLLGGGALFRFSSSPDAKN